jgi:hypothetical protein
MKIYKKFARVIRDIEDDAKVNKLTKGAQSPINK